MIKAQKSILLALSTIPLACLVLVVNGLSHPIPTQNVLYLTSRAHTICKGEVLRVNATGKSLETINGQAVSVKRMRAVFQIDRVFKGEKDLQQIAIDFFEVSDIPFISLEKNEYSLVFLNQPSSDVYTFVDPHVGKMPITSMAVPLPEYTLDTLGMIEFELIVSLRDENRDVVLTAIEQLGNVKKIKSTTPLKEMFLLDDKEIRGRVYSSLIKLGDYSLLEEALKFAEQQDENERIVRAQAAIFYAFREIHDEAMLPKLHELLRSENTDLRQNVIKALRAMKNPSSVPHFLRGLYDDDAEVRYDSLMALAAIENRGAEWSPASDTFFRDEVRYVEEWKNWWLSEGSRKYRQYSKQECTPRFCTEVCRAKCGWICLPPTK